MIPYDLDYETYYSKEYSVKDLGNYAYCQHPEFDAYLLTVTAPDFEWAGNPKEFDWERLEGNLFIAHNCGFELAVTERLRELGVVPKDLRWGDMVDTADLAAYLGYPRSLAGAAEHMLKVKVDKGVRDRAKGKRWRDMSPDFQREMVHYGKNDSKLGLRLWLEHGHKWPEWERELSRVTRQMCWDGIPVDRAGVDEAISKLEVLLWKVRSRIPWAEDPDAKALSPKAAAEECRKNGVPPPKSMAKDSEDFEEWLRKYGERFEWAKAMGSYRSINNFHKKLKVMQLRTKENGVMPIGLKYGGAHTLRDSGDTGFNIQNLPREPMFAEELTELEGKPSEGIDVRGLIMAPEGKMLAVADLSAIEPCCLAVFSGDEEMVGLLHQGMDPYEAFSRANGRWTGDLPLKGNDDDLRKYEKVNVLGCGYGAGPPKVQSIAKIQVGLEMTGAEAERLVKKFRARRFIPNLWLRLERAMRKSVLKDFELELPSGRVMRYRDVKDYGGLSAVGPRLGRMMRQRYWGGTLTENLVQSAARDVFMWYVLQMNREGMPPIMRVHDEAVCLFDEDRAEAGLKRMIEIMSTPPEWFTELPVSAEGHLCKRYTKG